MIRRACIDDYEAFVRLYPELETGDTVPNRERFERELVVDTWFATQGPIISGYLFGPCYDDMGYVRHLVVAPEHRRRGVARALMTAAAAHFRSQGAARWCLNVTEENAGAIRLYESFGLSRKGDLCAVRIRWDVVNRWAPPARNHTATITAPHDDAELESRFSLPTGLLGKARAQHRILRHVKNEQNEALGIAVFDPTFPGAFPFRAITLDAAQILLTSLGAHRQSSFDYIQLAIERDPALVDALLRRGATVHLRTLHMEGALSGKG